MGIGKRCRSRIIVRAQITQKCVAQAAPPGLCRIGGECAATAQPLIKRAHSGLVGLCSVGDQARARGMNGIGIGRVHGQCEFAFQGRDQHLRGKGRVFVRARQHIAQRVQIDRIGGGHVALLRRRGHVFQNIGGECLALFPAVEGILVVRHQGCTGFAIRFRADDDGRGKMPPDRQQGGFGHSDENELLFGLGQLQHAFFGAGGVFAFKSQRHWRAVPGQKAKAHRHVHRFLVRLARCRGNALA